MPTVGCFFDDSCASRSSSCVMEFGVLVATLLVLVAETLWSSFHPRFVATLVATAARAGTKWISNRL